MDPDPELGKLKAGPGNGIDYFGSAKLLIDVTCMIWRPLRSPISLRCPPGIRGVSDSGVSAIIFLMAVISTRGVIAAECAESLDLQLMEHTQMEKFNRY